MSHKEKENIVAFISNTLISIPYFTYVFFRYQNSNYTTEEELKYWATAILLIIPIRIVTHILIYVLFTIVRSIITGKNVKEDMITDERDRLIELKGDRNATNSFTFGVIIAMAAIVFGGSLSTMFGIMIIAGFLGEIFGIFSKMYYYRKGI